MSSFEGQSLGSDLRDISPDFIANDIDAKILRRIIRLAETPEAIKLFAAEHRKLTDCGYWFGLGTLWVSYTGYSDLQQWKWLFSSTRPNRSTSLMKPSELAIWKELPSVLTMLRVHRAKEEDWISYTLSIDAAKRFAAKRNAKSIAVYEVEKRNALCLFTRQCESEVLVLNRFHARKVKDVPVELISGGK